MVYASSPDRGLDRVLNLWPRIIKEVPEALLHVFYGFTLNFDKIHAHNQSMKTYKQNMLDLLNQTGVVYHGRVSHKELAKYFLACGLWVYPTSFTEISCITAMKAQCAGAIPITTKVAALDETVQFGVKIGGDNRVEHVKQVGAPDQQIHIIGIEELNQWYDNVVHYLKHPDEQEKMRTPMIDWARNKFDWSNVAKEWNGFFNEEVQQTVRSRSQQDRNVVVT